MKVLFAGTGEAFDNSLPNTSVIVEFGGTRVLVDCGFSAPQAIWRLLPGPDAIEAVYVTHLHADHCFGLPALVVRMHEEGRTRPLFVLAWKERYDSIVDLVDRAYPGIMGRLNFPLVHADIPRDGTGAWQKIAVSTAATTHGAENHAVRFDFESGASVMVSGDGEITPESAALFHGCTLVVHESYRIEESATGHSSVREVLATAAASPKPPRRVALVHTSRAERHRLAECAGKFFVPAPGTIMSFE